MCSRCPVIRVGVTGHCDLTSASAAVIYRAVRGELGPRSVRPLTGVSCLAAGADQIFARVVLDLGGRLEVVLPAPDYRERRVAPEIAAEFDALLAAASWVRVADFEHSCRQAYAAANAIMLGRVDSLVAVWDGRMTGRLGSTGGVVARARELGMPVTIVWPPTAQRAPVPVR